MEHIIGKLIQDYERGKMTRRQLIQTLALTATAANAVGTAEAAAPANAIYINHVSMQVADYTKTRDFYAGLFGMKVSDDDGRYRGPAAAVCADADKELPAPVATHNALRQ